MKGPGWRVGRFEGAGDEEGGFAAEVGVEVGVVHAGYYVLDVFGQGEEVGGEVQGVRGVCGGEVVRLLVERRGVGGGQGRCSADDDDDAGKGCQGDEF